jgi:tetratricopeptide (TPR) repeat protein
LKFLGAGNCRRELPASLETNGNWSRLALLFAALLSLPMPAVLAQCVPSQPGAQVEGIVRDSKGNPVTEASVRLQEEGRSDSVETKTNADGAFVFLAVCPGTYSVRLEKSGFHDAIEDSITLAAAERRHYDFVLRTSELSSPLPLSSTASSSSSIAMQLDDRPNFTVAGITDSTGAGGHGSETRMRTGEALAKQTLSLESGESRKVATPAPKAGAAGQETQASESALRAALLQNPRSAEANHRLGETYFHSERYCEAIPLLETAYQVNPGDHLNAFDLALAFQACGELAQAREQVVQMLAHEKALGQKEEADLRHLLGDLDEKLEDPLGAVREYERAAGLDATELNYFAWGTELLLHRAARPAMEVFGRGVRLHPDSARMLAGLGAALYTSGSADEAAERLCEASDLEPASPAPYLFLGQMQAGDPTPPPCVEQKLARFAQDQPENALANYYYGVALWKRDQASENSGALERAEALLKKSSAIDPKLDSAYLQLGNLYFARGALPEALATYQKAVAANPVGSQAHYRLGLTYKRMGENAKAQSEIEEYKQLEKTEAATIERQRRELREFLFVLQAQPSVSPSTSDPLPPPVSK